MKTQRNNFAQSFIKLFMCLLILSVVFSSCNKSEDVTIDAKQPSTNPITNTTLNGAIKGTLLTEKVSYNVESDIVVKSTDTLFVQRGVTVNVKNNATFYIQGTLIIEGSETSPIFFTTDAKKQGGWGGFQCDSAKSVSIKWAHIDYTGGPDGNGDPRKTLIVAAPIPVTIEDSWFKSGSDDGLRLQNGCTVSVLRNTIEGQGTTDGEAINIKGGNTITPTTGVVAYNVVWSTAGSAIKVETNKTIKSPQTNLKVYNNTVISNGFRRGASEPGRGILVDTYATGEYYNNMIVNCYQGLDITVNGLSNTKYGYNYFYTTIDSVRTFYYPAGTGGVKQSTDIVSTSKTDNDPSFVSFDANVNATTNGNDLHLKDNSPAKGKGNPTYNNDIGAYTSDGKGNKH